MKKIFLISIAALFMAACGKNETVADPAAALMQMVDVYNAAAEKVKSVGTVDELMAVAGAAEAEVKTLDEKYGVNSNFKEFAMQCPAEADSVRMALYEYMIAISDKTNALEAKKTVQE